MGRNVKTQLPALLLGIDLVTPTVFEDLLKQTGASQTYLKRLLRDSGTPLHPLVEGVRQDTLPNLMRTLIVLAEIYPSDRTTARAAVLESKRHTQILLVKNPADPWRNQVLLHLNTWLENPTVYPLWANLQMKSAAIP